MKLSDWHLLRQAEDLPEDQGDYGREPEYEQQGELTLILKKGPKALVVDPRQHYLVITRTGKDWWEGTRKDLGAIGREKALRAFDRS
jgi:hypothetical protein